jgi:glutathione synthase
VRIGVLVNRREELEPSQSSWLLAVEAARRGAEVEVAGVADLRRERDRSVRARVRAVRASAGSGTDGGAWGGERDADWSLIDRLWMRTNPGRDPGREGFHGAAMALVRILEAGGVRAVNGSEGLLRAATKAYLMGLPAWMLPRSVVASNPDEIQVFAESEPGPVVLKPLIGTHGIGVSKVDLRREGRAGLLRALEPLLARGPVMAQEYLLAGPDGDRRVIVADGGVLRSSGRAAVVGRRPPPGDFRSNVHAGGAAIPGGQDPRALEIGEAAAPLLLADGIRVAGLDVVGGKLIEVNAHSPGGLGEASGFEGVDFVGALADVLLS